MPPDPRRVSPSGVPFYLVGYRVVPLNPRSRAQADRRGEKSEFRGSLRVLPCGDRYGVKLPTSEGEACNFAKRSWLRDREGKGLQGGARRCEFWALCRAPLPPPPRRFPFQSARRACASWWTRSEAHTGAAGRLDRHSRGDGAGKERRARKLARQRAASRGGVSVLELPPRTVCREHEFDEQLGKAAGQPRRSG